MYQEAPEYEVRIKGHSLITVQNGGVRIDGKDFHSDLKNLSSLIQILSEVLVSAEEAKKPRVVEGGVSPAPIGAPKANTPFPYKVISK